MTLDRRAAERARRVEAGEAAADDDDVRIQRLYCDENAHATRRNRVLRWRLANRRASMLEAHASPAVAPPESHVETACPLDCPDACTLRRHAARRPDHHRSTDRRDNEITRGYICAKVRRFHHRVYGDDRLLHPAVRKGAKGTGDFAGVSWDDALDLIADRRCWRCATQFGAEAILPLSYGGSNGLLTQDTTDAMLFRRLGASRLLRTVCAAPTGAANQGLYGKMPSVTLSGLSRRRG